MKKSRKRALRYSREQKKGFRAQIPIELSENERFSTTIETSLLGQKTADGWTVIDVKRENARRIILTVENI